jgi:hypothetical protein
MSGVNIFSGYKQEEDRFTNGLISVLNLARFADPDFVPCFLRTMLGLPGGDITMFRVLQDIDGTADAELRGEDCCIQFETKVASGTLRSEQIEAHLSKLRQRTESVRRLVLLTPDDGNSKYVSRFLSQDSQLLLHLGWKRVYEHLEAYLPATKGSVLAELIRQFLERIHQRVFEQDIAGIILKTDFGEKSGVFEDAYLQEFQADAWSTWNTPREYKNLDGTGRKLLLYDRTRKGVTAEVEIKKVELTNAEPDYPWTNEFEPGTLRVFSEPIPLSHIQTITGFENFGVYKKDRSPYRNITHSQYRQLLSALTQ